MILKNLKGHLRETGIPNIGSEFVKSVLLGTPTILRKGFLKSKGLGTGLD